MGVHQGPWHLHLFRLKLDLRCKMCFTKCSIAWIEEGLKTVIALPSSSLRMGGQGAPCQVDKEGSVRTERFVRDVAHQVLPGNSLGGECRFKSGERGTHKKQKLLESNQGRGGDQCLPSRRLFSVGVRPMVVQRAGDSASLDKRRRRHSSELEYWLW